jgi:hypothetical protein
MSIYKQATRLMLRFTVPGLGGAVDVEDLWSLKLNKLNEIAIALYNSIKQSTEISFINEQSKTDVENELKLEIVKDIIATKKAEAEELRIKSENNSRKQELLKALDGRKQENLKNMSEEELLAELKKVE